MSARGELAEAGRRLADLDAIRRVRGFLQTRQRYAESPTEYREHWHSTKGRSFRLTP